MFDLKFRRRVGLPGCIEDDPLRDPDSVPQRTARTFDDDGGIRVTRRAARRAKDVARKAKAVIGGGRSALARESVRANLKRAGLLDDNGRLIRNRRDRVKRTAQQERIRNAGKRLANAERGQITRARAAFRRAQSGRRETLRRDTVARRRAARQAELARQRAGLIR